MIFGRSAVEDRWYARNSEQLLAGAVSDLYAHFDDAMAADYRLLPVPVHCYFNEPVQPLDKGL